MRRCNCPHGIDGRTQAGVRYGAPDRRVAYGTANCRDLRALSAAISCLPEIKTQAALFGQAMLRELTGKIDLLEDIRALVEQAIVDEPPILLREGGMIRKGLQRGD